VKRYQFNHIYQNIQKVAAGLKLRVVSNIQPKKRYQFNHIYQNIQKVAAGLKLRVVSNIQPKWSGDA
jgi:uncharacterized protein (DUF2249 family)